MMIRCLSVAAVLLLASRPAAAQIPDSTAKGPERRLLVPRLRFETFHGPRARPLLRDRAVPGRGPWALRLDPGLLRRHALRLDALERMQIRREETWRRQQERFRGWADRSLERRRELLRRFEGRGLDLERRIPRRPRYRAL